ncbi:hypothetical protein BKA70DRAFT_1432347 [Coprinopsis sp. MPI-PUGE-AT-0042]|nr:hypothetical protein BKA70DRAFT_1432347 [Coprinopsis sp. MPI-PUGE-AT-0042]
MNERHPRSQAAMESLAPETLSEIFLYCLPQPPLRISPSTSHPPLQLTLVCHRWRSVALASPALWTRVNIVLDLVPQSRLNTPDAFDAFEQKIQHQEEGVIRWLTQAANVPTHICNEIFTSKWETLDIGGEDWNNRIAYPYREFFLSIPKEHLTSLKTLYYMYKSTPMYAAEQGHSLDLRNLTFRKSGIAAAPSLKALHITRLHQDDKLGRLAAVWTNLTELSLTGGYETSSVFETGEVLQAISRCATTLQTLHASVGAPDDPSLDVTTIVLPRLEVMAITEMGEERGPPSKLKQFMSALVTPVLSKMNFETGCSPECAYDGEVSSLLIFVQVHQSNLSNLTDLRFEYNWLSPDELTEPSTALWGRQICL